MKKVFIVVLVVLSAIIPGTIFAQEKTDSIVMTQEEFLECDNLPDVFYVVENDGKERVTGISTKYVYQGKYSQYSANWGYHPSFSTWQYCDGYVLSTSSSVGMSISVAYGGLSITVAGASSSGSIIVNADNSRASRPYVYGTVVYDYYITEIYDSMGNLVTTGTYKDFLKNESVLGYGVKYK